MRILALAALLGLTVRECAAAQGEIAATVNGAKITVAEWRYRLERMSATDFVVSGNPPRLKSGTAGRLMLQAMISQTLLLQYASRTGLLATDAEVTETVEQFKAQPGISQAIEKKYLTEADLKRDALVQRTLYNVATVNSGLTPADVRAYYDSHPELFGKPERWQLAIIRVTGKEKADRVAAELKKGTLFATVATQLSEDEGTKANGGELGYVAANDRTLPEPLREAIRTLKVGGATPAVAVKVADAQGKPADVFFFARLLGKADAVMTPFEQVKDRCERMARLQKAGGLAAAEKKIEEFRKTSKVTVSLPGYEDLFAEPPAPQEPGTP